MMAKTYNSVLFHEKVKIILSKFNNIHDQMTNLKIILLLQRKDIQQRAELRLKIEKLIKEINPDFFVHLYGSSINGIGFLNSDVDLFVDLPTNGNVNEILFIQFL